MSVTYTIETVGEPREWSSEKHGGRFFAYPLDLKDSDGFQHSGVEWSRKHDSRAPQTGERIAGTISNGQHGDKIKVDYDATKELNGGTQGGSSGGRSGSSKTREWKPESEYDPEKTARIGRSHAQEMAIRALTAMGIFESKSADQLEATIKSWIDFFQADVDAAAKAARSAGGGTGDGPASGSAALCTPPSVQSGNEAREVHERLTSLLEEAGVNDRAAQVITDYALDQMTSEEQDAAITQLQNENMRQGAVNRLRERVESFSGQWLPGAGTETDDIPF